MNVKYIKVCLVSPVPPPHGGMGRGTDLVHQWVAGEPLISVAQVDTSPRWRAIDDLVVWKRIIGGSFQLIYDYAAFLKAARGAHVIHLATSGRLATVRDIVICVTARLLKKPLIYHLHFGTVPEISKKNTLVWRLLSSVMRLANIVFALDDSTAETIRGLLPEVQVKVIPNPINLSLLPTPLLKQSAQKIALFLGWVLPTKGIEELLQSWSSCAAEGWELVIAGPFNPVYRDMLINRHHPPSVSFIGELNHNDAMKLLGNCDLFVLPSHTEAFPYVVLEAMSLGKPIVATRVGAIPEMLADGCGEVVPAKDAGALAVALTKMMSDEMLRKDCGFRAHQKASSCYSTNVVMNAIYSLWQQLATTQKSHVCNN
jgi:glycosyltransferase involved in cell wall biosynthesis